MDVSAKTSGKRIIDSLIFKDEVFNIIGSAFEVHNNLGCGFLEPVYQEALEVELRDREIPYQSQIDIPISYKEHKLKKTYRADFIVYSKIIMEIKAIAHITPTDESQVINYLKATGLKLGLLVNFGSNKMEWKRLVF